MLEDGGNSEAVVDDHTEPEENVSADVLLGLRDEETAAGSVGLVVVDIGDFIEMNLWLLGGHSL